MGVDYRSEFWGPRSKKDYRCADCGRSRQEVREIDVHHIGDGDLDDRDNLIGLCRRCHLQARHRRDTVPGTSPFEPDQPTAVTPRKPGARALSPGP